MATRHTNEARTLTLHEWAELPEDTEGELVDGRLVEEEMPGPEHERAVIWLGAELLRYVNDRGGSVFGSELKYRVGAKRGRKPDLSVVLPGRPQPSSRAMLMTVTPDIMIEIITATPRDHARDRIDKAREYARIGVRWYWLVDPAAQTLEILELGPKKRYVNLTTASSGRLKVPGCRGLQLDLDALWRCANR